MEATDHVLVGTVSTARSNTTSPHIGIFNIMCSTHMNKLCNSQGHNDIGPERRNGDKNHLLVAFMLAVQVVCPITFVLANVTPTR